MKFKLVLLFVLFSVLFVSCSESVVEEPVQNETTEEVDTGKESVFTPSFNTGSEVIELPDLVSCVSDYDCNSICVGEDIQPRECIERSDDEVALALIDEFNISLSKLELYREQLVAQVEAGTSSQDRLDELDELIDYGKGEMVYFDREEKWICTNALNIDETCSAPLSCVENKQGAYCSCTQDSDCGNVCGNAGVIEGTCSNNQCVYDNSREQICPNGGACVEGLEGALCYSVNECSDTVPEVLSGIEYNPIRMSVTYEGDSTCQNGTVIKVSNVNVYQVENDNTTPIVGYRTLIEERICKKILGRNALVPDEGSVITTSTATENFISQSDSDYHGEIFERFELLANECVDENRIALAYCDATDFFNTTNLEIVDCSEFGEGFTCQEENGVGYCG